MVIKMGDGALFHILPEVSCDRLQLLKYANFLAALRTRAKKSWTCDHLPIDLTVDFTTICQLHCPCCSVGNKTIHRKKTLIPVSRYASFFDDVGDALFIVWNFSAGEPLLHKKCADLIRISSQREVFSIISSNLSMKLSRGKIDDILMSGLGMLSVSLDGVNPISYLRYRWGGDFNLVLENLATIVRRKCELGLTYPIIEWRYLIFEHNQNDLDQAKLMAKDIGVDLLEFHAGFAPAESEVPNMVRPMTCPMPFPSVFGPALERGKSRETPLLRSYISGRTASLKTDPPKDFLCDWLYFSGMVYPDGSIGPCCVATNQEDDFTFLGDNRFLFLWNNDVYQKARKRCGDGQFSGTVCDRCPAPYARRYQFRNRLRAILLNSPEWVLQILHLFPLEFFLPDDYVYMPLEIDAIIKGSFLDNIPNKALLTDITQRIKKLNCSMESTSKLLEIFDDAMLHAS
jgi:MoaA/NifB/PqqE/SkfB family radical SAM enzyme